MRKNAFTILEMSIVLAIIGILIAGIVGVAGSLRQTAFVMEAAQTINSLHQAANGYLAVGNTNFSGISVAQLITDNLLPSGFSGTGTNPWGGNYTIAPNTDNSKIDIGLTSVPTVAGNRLSDMFQNSADNVSLVTTTFTVTF